MKLESDKLLFVLLLVFLVKAFIYINTKLEITTDITTSFHRVFNPNHSYSIDAANVVYERSWSYDYDRCGLRRCKELNGAAGGIRTPDLPVSETLLVLQPGALPR